MKNRKNMLVFAGIATGMVAAALATTAFGDQEGTTSTAREPIATIQNPADHVSALSDGTTVAPITDREYSEIQSLIPAESYYSNEGAAIRKSDLRAAFTGGKLLDDEATGLAVSAVSTTGGAICFTGERDGEIRTSACTHEFRPSHINPQYVTAYDGGFEMYSAVADDVANVQIETSDGTRLKASLGHGAFAWTGSRSEHPVRILVSLQNGDTLTEDVRDDAYPY